MPALDHRRQRIERQRLALELRGARFDRLLAAFYVAAFLLTEALLSAQIGGPALPDALAFWLYPALQPLGRALIGAWLWRHARDEVT